uniref:KH type-2 domain-containing protein n=1 Tax=Sarcophilus harrisii TaxID=9305 RepID=A0A7N4NSI3_SARHA
MKAMKIFLPGNKLSSLVATTTFSFFLLYFQISLTHIKYDHLVIPQSIKLQEPFQCLESSWERCRCKMAVQISKKRKFVADGIFKAKLNEFLTRELAADGYSGVEVRVTPTRTEIIILATRTQNVLGEKGRRIHELTAVVQKRFGFPEGSVELYAEKVATRGLCAEAQRVPALQTPRRSCHA